MVKLPGASLLEIKRYYEEHPEKFFSENVHYTTQPLVMQELIYYCLSLYGLNLLPHCRDVLLCFEHVAFDACVHKEVKVKLSTLAPVHCIVLQVKFLHTNEFFNVGTIGYKSFTQREFVAELIKEYIEDCFRADLRVLATCSSGQFEIMNILAEMPVTYLVKNSLISYPVRGRGRVAHIFDPSWLMRKMKGMFFTNDVTFTFETQRYVASFDNMHTLFCHPSLVNLFPSEVYDKCLKTTSSAAKTFSHTTSVLLEGLYVDNAASFKRQPEAVGTKIFCHIFDQLFDSFNAISQPVESPKTFRNPLTTTSPHWALWDAYVPVLNSMRFHSRPPDELKKRKGMPKVVRNKLIKNNNHDVESLLYHDCNNSELLKAQASGIPIEYYVDNEYSRVEPGDNHTDLVSLLSTFLHRDKNERDATLPVYVHEMSEQLKDTCMARSVRRQEALSKELYTLKARVEQHKRKAVHDTLVKNVLVLLNTASIYNDELKLKHSKRFTYEYMSIHMELKLKNVACVLEDSVEFYQKLLDELTSIVNTLRFLNFSVFQCWLTVIAGVRNLFDVLSKRHCKSFDTKIVNCDAIHSFIQYLRKENGMMRRVLVETPVYGRAHDFLVSALALTEKFNWTITTTLFEVEEKPSAGAGKKKGRRGRRSKKSAEGVEKSAKD